MPSRKRNQGRARKAKAAADSKLALQGKKCEHIDCHLTQQQLQMCRNFERTLYDPSVRNVEDILDTSKPFDPREEAALSMGLALFKHPEVWYDNNNRELMRKYLVASTTGRILHATPEKLMEIARSKTDRPISPGACTRQKRTNPRLQCAVVLMQCGYLYLKISILRNIRMPMPWTSRVCAPREFLA